MSSFRELLLKEASRRFEEQQKQSEAAASTTLMAPISPSPPQLIEEALKRLAAEECPTGTPLIGLGSQIIDLGCGDGRWLSAAVAMFKEECVQCVGYDLNEELLQKARVAAADLEAKAAVVSRSSELDAPEKALAVNSTLKNNRGAEASSEPVASHLVLPSLEFRQCDLLLADVSKASVVIAYLFREGCAVVQEKLERELACTGTAVLSVGFSFKGWEARWSLRPKGSVPLYFYSPPWREKQVSVATTQPEVSPEKVDA